MTIMDDLCDDATWDEYLRRKVQKSEDDPAYVYAITSYIKGRKYRKIVEAVAKGEYRFSDPVMIEVPKSNGKTRVVYTFKGNDLGEHLVICVISTLLYRYDAIFSPNLYSAKKSDSVYDVMQDILSIKDLDKKYFLKMDFSDYGNSIDCDKSLEVMRSKIPECDSAVVDMFEMLLRNPNVIKSKMVDGKLVRERTAVENKGSMAGLATSTFLCNVYLSDMDWHFFNLNVPYVRFFDDILVIGDSLEEVQSYKEYILEVAKEKKLLINDDKMIISVPGEYLSHLGLEIRDGQIAISPDVVTRNKKKMKSYARRYNIMARNGKISRRNAMRLMIDSVNHYFYNPKDKWSFARTYFPRITSNAHLSEIDSYVQECIRFVYLGEFRESNKMRVDYSILRDNGYIPLVSAYRMFRDSRKYRSKVDKTMKEIFPGADDYSEYDGNCNDGVFHGNGQMM